MRIFWNGFTIVARSRCSRWAVRCAPSQLTEIGSVNLLPRVGNLSRPDWMTYSGSKNEFNLREVTAADLVNATAVCGGGRPGDSGRQRGW